MRPSWTRSRSQFQSCLSVTVTALPKSSSAGIVFVASRACSAQPRNLVHAAARASDQALQKCRMPTVMSEKKWTSQSDKMMRCTFFYARPALHFWKAVFPLWRTTAQHLGRGCEWRLWSSQIWKWRMVCTSRSCSRFFLRKWLTLRANIKRMTNQRKNGTLFVGQDVSPSLGVSTLASSEREQVSREQM